MGNKMIKRRYCDTVVEEVHVTCVRRIVLIFD